MTTGERIAQKRKELGLSQEALGERMGVSRQAIYKWESDATLPEIEKLVNLSREFSVSIDWLLGKEDAVQEDRELTPEQLRMVEEIVGRYLAARSGPEEGTTEPPENITSAEQELEVPAKPEKKRRWPWVLAAAVLVGVLLNLFSRLDQIDRNYQNLESNVGYLRTDINNQIYGITSRVEDILQKQNSLTAEQSAQVELVDCAANTVTISARALPRTYTEGMTAEFLLVSGGEMVTVPGTLEEDHSFTAQVTGPLSDDITVSAAFLTGDRRETQQLGQFSGLYSMTFPDVSVQGNLWKSGNQVNEYAWVQMYGSSNMYGIPTAEIAQIRVGLFRDRKLAVWYEQLDGQPNNFGGAWNNSVFFQLNEGYTVESGPVYIVAAVVTDEYGRDRIFTDLPMVYDETQDFIEHYNGEVYDYKIWDLAEWEY